MNNSSNERSRINISKPVKVSGFIGCEFPSENLSPDQKYIYKKINNNIDVKFDEHGLKIEISPNGHGAESISIYSFTEIMINMYAMETEKYQMTGKHLAVYRKTFDVREGTIIYQHFDNVEFSLTNANDKYVLCELYLKKVFNADFFNPLYSEEKLISAGDFIVSLKLEITN